eukprot:TRINITY_DN67441_c0_g1_i2.p2 TRINITY_DN67441_c0_g1~~TRINITY_DN67441_c0_g1_i2.p2  ORF type:complete len:369 (-),score=47.00 TRINITY_DN67441_c0_g1_i2:433-1539(-)
MDFTFTSPTENKEVLLQEQIFPSGESIVGQNEGLQSGVINLTSVQNEVMDVDQRIVSQYNISSQNKAMDSYRIVSLQNKQIDQKKEEQKDWQQKTNETTESPKKRDIKKKNPPQANNVQPQKIKTPKIKRMPALSDETWSGFMPSKYKVQSQALAKQLVLPSDDMSKLGVVRVAYSLDTIEYEGMFNVYTVKLKDAYNQVIEEVYTSSRNLKIIGSLESQLKNLAEDRQWLDGRVVEFDAKFLSSIWDGKTLILQVNQPKYDDEGVNYLEQGFLRESNIGLGFDVTEEISILGLAPFKYREVFENKLAGRGWIIPNLEELCKQSGIRYENNILIATVLQTVQFRKMKSFGLGDPIEFGFLSAGLGIIV